MRNILQRIKQFSDTQGISIRKIEESIGASNGVISNALRKNSDIQSKWVAIIIEKYTYLNPVWLITGKGKMLTDSYIPEENNQKFASEGNVDYFNKNNNSNKNDIIIYLENQIQEMQKEIKSLYGQIAVLEHKLSNYESK